jgi:hypothetical protein
LRILGKPACPADFTFEIRSSQFEFLIAILLEDSTSNDVGPEMSQIGL